MADRRRRVLRRQLHETYAPGAYDNWQVWAGALSVEIDGLRFDATLARAVHDGAAPAPRARVRCEVFVAAVEAATVRPGDLEARLWTDALAGLGTYVAMHLRTGADGAALPCGNNLVFESEPVALRRPGAFAYTVELRAHGAAAWIAINDMGANRDGVIVVSPAWVAAAPSVTEVCLRKVGARLVEGRFRSGRIACLTESLEEIATDVVYLLPFFRPGWGDLHTGQDVRKGQLGSVYAVADFFRLDPDLVTPLEAVDLAAMVQDGAITDEDVRDLWEEASGTGPHGEASPPHGGPLGGQPAPGQGPPPPAARLAALGALEAAARWGDGRLVQLVGRGELRRLTRRAHQLGKKVIFDLVLMQTSRDSPLVAQHPDWYVLDAQGRPRIHRIAWLVYSDVALFDLTFNEPLQEYLLEVAPYWMARCGFDGVRIDASQTVDRPFLKRLKNRIQGLDPQALVLGETLCPLAEAVDIPVDMVYALLVDFHRDADRASPLIGLLEEMHGTFAAGTVAMAYFENHDSPRATHIWRQRFAACLADDPDLRARWRARLPSSTAVPIALWMALLKNLQASLIDASAGMAPAPGSPLPPDQRPARAGGTQLAWTIEWGSDWGEETRTDFENPTLLHPEQRRRPPRARLVAAYRCLAALTRLPPLRAGGVYYHPNHPPGGDPEDRVLAYTRYTPTAAIVAAHNLDAAQSRRVTLDLGWLGWTPAAPGLLFDSYQALGLPLDVPAARLDGASLQLELAPLQSRLWQLPGAPPRKETRCPIARLPTAGVAACS